MAKFLGTPQTINRGLAVAGKVFLVGAGPGDPELLTLAGMRALQSADCVVYDKLIDARLLDHAPERAERHYVGKQAGVPHDGSAQATINGLLVALAQDGKTVVRLKGGDPLLFARGGEEALALAQAGIAYEIIPGVTAALAAAAMAAIPLTQRGVSSAVALVTGHEDPHKSAHLDWRALAQFRGTLVVYMALAHAARIARALIEHGMEPATPMAFVEWAGTRRQRVARLPLNAAIAGPPPGFASPVLAIIGPVCDLREQLAWWERLPLFGQRILVPRPRHQAEVLARQLEALGAQVDCAPVLEILPPDDWKPVDEAIAKFHADVRGAGQSWDWLVFTSPNGVDGFLGRLFSLGLDWRCLADTRIAAIGPGTAAALEKHHLRADVVPDEFRAEGLAAALQQEIVGKRILLARANRGRTVLADEWGPRAEQLTTVVVYRQDDVSAPAPEIVSALRAGKISWVMLSSANMATGFFRWLDEETTATVRRHTRLLSISPITSVAISAAGFSVAKEATTFSIPGMVDALLEANSFAKPGFDNLPDQQT